MERRDYLSGRMAEERAEAIRTARPRAWAEVVTRHPVVFALVFLVGVFLAFELTYYGILMVFGNPQPDTDAYANVAAQLVGELLACAFVIAVVVALGWWRAVGFTAPRSWRQTWLVWLPALLLAGVFLGSIDDITHDVGWLALAIPLNFSVGFFEEALMRGLVLFLLLYAWRHKPRGVLWAVLASSALFGLLHLVNLIAEGQPLVDTLLQVGQASLQGVGLAGLALRTNTLWLGVLWHGLWDSVGGALPGPPMPAPPETPGVEGVVQSIFIAGIPLLIYGLVLIRRRRARTDQPAADTPATAG